MEEPEPLYATCRNCSSPVPTGMRLTGKVYEISITQGYDLTCPACGTMATYTKVEFHMSDQRS